MIHNLTIKKVFLFSFLLAFTNTIHSQKYSFTTFSIKDGLPHSSIKVLLQDSRGLIWIGTKGGGICQYDGYSFYTLLDQKKVLGTEINSIVEDKKGRIWCGTNNGVALYNGSFFIDVSARLFKGNVNKLYVDNNGNLWILTKKSGLIGYNTDEAFSLEHKLGDLSKLKSNNFKDISEDDFGRFWIVSDSGLVIIDPNLEMSMVELGVKYALPKNHVSAVARGGEAEMWVGTENSGVYLLKYDSLSCYAKRSYNSYFDNIDDNIISVTVDKSNKVWLGTDDQGIVYIDYPFVKKMSKDNGLESNEITDILEDSEGNIWIGTRNHGIKVFAGWHFVHYNSESGLSENSITSIVQDSEGFYWCSGLTGIYRMKRRNEKLRVFNVLLPDEYKGIEVTDILLPNRGEVIFGTSEHGILWIRDNTIVAIDKEAGLPNDNVSAMYYSSDSLLWVSTKGGIVKVVNDSIVKLPEIEGVAGIEVNSIAEDGNGTMWFGHDNGIYRYSGGAFSLFAENSGLKHVRVRSLYVDNWSNLWIGTLGGGVYVCKLTTSDTDSLRAELFLPGEKLISNNIYSISGLKDSILILGTDKGINRVQLKNDSALIAKAVYSYDNTNGFINLECNANSILVDEAGYVWFGTKSGLTCYDPNRELPIQEKPKVYITGLEVNFEKLQWQTKSEVPSEWFAFTDNLSLKHNQNYINLSFSGVYYSEGLWYEYFMQGLDKDWSTPTKQRFVSFSKLNPGRYTFKVRAVTNSGLMSRERSFSFRIKPPFWQTWWFILLMFVLAVIVVIWIIRFRERRLKHAKEVLEETVKIRTEEIRQQKVRIETQQKSLTDSIQYAKRIQDAVISEPEGINKYIKDYFIIFLPRDIVSGDFYWFGEVGNKFIFSVADCTGHGVPGAFMSMLGIRLLNEIVLERKVTEPNEILNRLRGGVIQSLKQDDEDSESRDGMDMSLCMFDKDNNRLCFAGAYNSLWLIRENEVIAYKGDRMPIAIYDKIDEFKCYDIECRKGDRIYLFSDGFSDQFGGPDIKKYKSKRLKDMILSTADLPMEEQREVLLNDFNSWKGDQEQVDDVSLMGVQF